MAEVPTCYLAASSSMLLAQDKHVGIVLVADCSACTSLHNVLLHTVLLVEVLPVQKPEGSCMVTLCTEHMGKPCLS
jgi:hypothetical protein